MLLRGEEGLECGGERQQGRSGGYIIRGGGHNSHKGHHNFCGDHHNFHKGHHIFCGGHHNSCIGTLQRCGDGHNFRRDGHKSCGGEHGVKGGVRIKKTGKTIKILSLFVGMSELSCNFATTLVGIL